MTLFQKYVNLQNIVHLPQISSAKVILNYSQKDI